MTGPLGTIGRWVRAPLRTLTVFVSLALALTTALVYLAWKTIESDRVIEQQQAIVTDALRLQTLEQEHEQKKTA